MYMQMYICMYMYVLMYMFACMYICLYMYVCMYVSNYVCMYVHVCIYIDIYTYVYRYNQELQLAGQHLLLLKERSKNEVVNTTCEYLILVYLCYINSISL